MPVNCENTYCIYYEKGCCLLDKVHINFFGICSDCIIVDIPEKELDKLRNEQRK